MDVSYIMVWMGCCDGLVYTASGTLAYEAVLVSDLSSPGTPT